MTSTHRGRVPRICIVTADITGPIRNGGIGTAYYSLARLLADAGHEVTVLYALGRHSEQEPVSHWVREFSRWGIELVPLPDPPGPQLRGSIHVRIAWAVYAWLKTRAFDVVHFHEWRGVGYYALVGKQLGLCLQEAVTVVGAHSPSLWHKAGMNDLPSTVGDVEVDFLERESVARADVLWSPSRHMLRWMQHHGWRLPARRVIQQYVILERAERPRRRATPIEELCFFGRLETRKGLDLFCAAVDLLASRGALPKRITFLGKLATVGDVDSATYIAGHSSRWPVPCEVHSTLDRGAAMAYLAQPGRLAVLPSRIDNLPYTVLECVAGGVPLVASATGGIPEIIRPADHANRLFPLRPEALASVLEHALRRGMRPAGFRVAPENSDRGWLALHREWATARARRTVGRRRRPRVTVCITHRNRPHLLRQALASVAAQDYEPLDVVVVDDGSDRPEAIAGLRRLEGDIERRGWQLLRQPNRFPGAARNAAARVARGEYLLFMDDDNYAKRGAVTAFVDAALASGADIVTCFLDMFQGDGPPTARAATQRWPFLGPSPAVGVARNAFGDTNCLVRAAAWQELGGMSEDFGIGCEDWEFFARAVLAGKRLEVLPEALAWYRQSTTGVQATTHTLANRARALRPYTRVWPPDLHSVLPLCRDHAAPADTPASPIAVDHVRRVVVFGCGEGGRLAIALARRCGWEVAYLVDNNQSSWGREAHGRPVRDPQTLQERDFDLVIVASVSGRDALFRRLASLGLRYPEHVVYFLDVLSIGSVSMQLRL